MNFLWYILIGILSGFVAGKLMRGGGFGVIVNLIVGIIGGVLGGWLFGLLGIFNRRHHRQPHNLSGRRNLPAMDCRLVEPHRKPLTAQ